MFGRSRHRYHRYHRYCDRMGNCFSSIRAIFNPSNRNRTNPSNEISISGRSNRSRHPNVIPDTPSLVVRDVDYMIEKNGWFHFTHKFAQVSEGNKLIIRRGTPFKIKIIFQRNISINDDVINLIFTVKDASNPNYSQKTQITIPVVLNENSTDSFDLLSAPWNARAITIDDNITTLEINSAPDAIIGEWKLVIDTKSRSFGNRSLFSNAIKDPITILFNPWHKKDSVFMRDKEALREFVLNDTGIIWRGTHDRLKPTPWNYAQHEHLVLEACLYAISNIGKLNVVDRGDPIKVARHISSIVNSVDDDGIVQGNWTSSFFGGTAPTDWHGSLVIMQKYYKNKRPVKFGQCWVFSGVTNTMARCLGIPARVITNYLSAHDTHNSLTVDRFFDEEGEPLKEYNKDSVWNFHSWVEVWMARPDLSLSGAYDGWQVIDATPQEASDGIFRVGPTSVEAIKQGEVNKPFDGHFVYAEVNADEVYWLHQGPKQPVKFISHTTDNIGQVISTKGILSNHRVDLTDNYKHLEKSFEERETMLKALRMAKSEFSRYYLNEKFEDITFDFLLIDDVLIGSPFKVRLRMKNKSGNVYNVKTVIVIRTSLYTGVTKSVVKKDSRDFIIGPRDEEEVIVNVTYDEYEIHLYDQSIFNITVMANVVETNFQYYAMDDFRLRMPDIIIQTEGDMIEGKPFTCHAYFQNPLPRSLNKGVFSIEGPELTTRLKMALKRPVLPHEEAKVTFIVIPKVSGKKIITAKFMSRELNDVDGYKTIRISPSLPSFNNNPESNNNTLDYSF